MLTFISRHRRKSFGLVVIHAGVIALGLLQMREHTIESGCPGTLDQPSVVGIQGGRGRRNLDPILFELGNPMRCVLIFDAG